MLRLRSFFHFHIIELILRRGMGLVRDAEFGGNSVIWLSSFSTWVCRYLGCSGPPWAHDLDFNLAQVRLPSKHAYMGPNGLPIWRAQPGSKWVPYWFFLLIWFFTSHQQSFSYIGTSVPGFNQYKARINVSCSRTTTQGRRWDSNPRPFGLESSTLPLSHCAPYMGPIWVSPYAGCPYWSHITVPWRKKEMI